MFLLWAGNFYSFLLVMKGVWEVGEMKVQSIVLILGGQNKLNKPLAPKLTGLVIFQRDWPDWLAFIFQNYDERAQVFSHVQEVLDIYYTT